MASMPLTHERSIKDQFLARVNFIKSRTMLAARETYRLRNSSLGNYEIHKLKWSRINSEKKKRLLRLVLYDYSLAFSSRYQTFTRKDSNFKAEKDLKSAKISIFLQNIGEFWFKTSKISPHLLSIRKRCVCTASMHMVHFRKTGPMSDQWSFSFLCQETKSKLAILKDQSIRSIP